MSALEFDAASHTYRVDGCEVPSVTRILSILDDWSGIPAAVLDAAREFGDHVHRACHLLNAGALDTASLDDNLLPYVSAWRKFLKDTGAIVVASEERVHHGRRYAGTLDCIVEWGGLAVADIKTGSTVPRSVGPQTIAYASAYEDMYHRRIKRRYCVHLMPNDYRLIPLADTRDQIIFQSALNIHAWRAKNAA